MRLGCGQFWPYFLPVVGAQVAAGDYAVGGGLDGCAMFWWYGAAANAPVAYRALHHTHCGSQFAYAADDLYGFVELFHAHILNTFVLKM